MHTRTRAPANTKWALLIAVSLTFGISPLACSGDGPVTDAPEGGATSSDSSSRADGTIAAEEPADGSDAGGDAACADAADLTADDKNCGRCGHVCSGGFACTESKCGDEVEQVAAGAGSACARLHDGSVWCWGWTVDGNLGVAPSSADSTCAKTFGCRGVAVKVPFPSGTAIADIAFGRTHACAADSSGQAWCWGSNANGQLGQPLTVATSPTPVGIALPAGARVAQVAVGQYTSCARTAVSGGAGDVYCWGGNSVGEAGNALTLPDGGPNTTLLVPELVGVFAHDVEYVALSQDAGSQQHACAIRSDGTVWCWGENGARESGQPSGAYYTQPTQVAGITGATSIAVGPSVTCAVAKGVVLCWGANFYSELGSPCASTTTAVPVLVPGLPDAGMVAVASGEWLQFAVDHDGHAYSWGILNSGALGTGALTGRTCSNGLVGVDAPAQISALSGVVQIGAGEQFGVAVKSDGTAYSWGANNLAQLGHVPGDAADQLCSDASTDFCHPLPSAVTALPH